MIDKICWLDIVLLLPLLFGFIRGIMRGLIAELSTLIAIVLGVVVARIWGLELAHYIQAQLECGQHISSLLAYISIFLAVTLVFQLLGMLAQKLLKAIKMGWINHLLGALTGTLKWAVVMLVIIFTMGQADQQFHFMPNDLKQQSWVYAPALELSNHIWHQLK